MKNSELTKIIEEHQHYLKKDCKNWCAMRADLRHANLIRADLREINLYDACMRYVNLSGADLFGANLSKADLRCANLTNAVLIGANLDGAKLDAANLYGANLYKAQNIPFIPYVCPEHGTFIGYKRTENLIVEIEIPSDANRLSGTTRKCRCNKAKVLRILNEDGSESEIQEVASFYDENFVYAVGAMVEVDDFDEDRWTECSRGIHFFINFQEAVNYQFT